MARASRVQLIRRIERARKSRVITYVTSTRPNLEVQMAIDSIRWVYDHLEQIKGSNGKVNIDLYICSNGGDGTVPWRLVTLIREYADRFSVLVPFRAFSAATLTALGADEIVMHPMGILGPTDPTVSNQFNPLDPANNRRRLGISVEDVTAYIALVKEDAGIQHEDQLVQAFNLLADKVHPLALGNVKRSLSQSRMMAGKLLNLHMNSATHQHQMEQIVDNLTSKLFYHGHPINRIEAKEQIGLETVQNPSAAVEKAMWNLYLEYEKELRTTTPFDVAAEFLSDFPAQATGTVEKTANKSAKLAYIESTGSSDVCTMNYELVGEKKPDGSTAVTMITTKNASWSKE